MLYSGKHQHLQRPWPCSQSPVPFHVPTSFEGYCQTPSFDLLFTFFEDIWIPLEKKTPIKSITSFEVQMYLQTPPEWLDIKIGKFHWPKNETVEKIQPMTSYSLPWLILLGKKYQTILNIAVLSFLYAILLPTLFLNNI